MVNVNWNWDVIDKKVDIAHFTLVYRVNLEILTVYLIEVIWIILWHCYLEIDRSWKSVPKKSVMVISILQIKCTAACPSKLLGIPTDIVVETWWVKNCTARFCNHSIGIRSYLTKSYFKFNLQKHHFVYVHELIIKCYLNFITCLYFPLALIRWNSSHCHPMELFKSKESCK